MQTRDPSEHDALAKCLTEKGFSMGGTSWCSHCQEQKDRFGPSFQYIDYHDCDEDSWCDEHDITGYPTWITQDGAKLMGAQFLDHLASISGC